MTLRPRPLEAQSMYSDWTYTWKVHGQLAWDAEDQVILVVNPEHIMWDDYGFHSRTYPQTYLSTPWFRATSDDGSDYVELVEPDTIELLVPYSQLQLFGPGMVNVGVQRVRTDTDRRSTVFYGRLPLLDTGGV